MRVIVLVALLFAVTVGGQLVGGLMAYLGMLHAMEFGAFVAGFGWAKVTDWAWR